MARGPLKKFKRGERVIDSQHGTGVVVGFSPHGAPLIRFESGQEEYRFLDYLESLDALEEKRERELIEADARKERKRKEDDAIASLSAL